MGYLYPRILKQAQERRKMKVLCELELQIHTDNAGKEQPDHLATYLDRNTKCVSKQQAAKDGGDIIARPGREELYKRQKKKERGVDQRKEKESLKR